MPDYSLIAEEMELRTNPMPALQGLKQQTCPQMNPGATKAWPDKE